jgi:hypothetical protein
VYVLKHFAIIRSVHQKHLTARFDRSGLALLFVVSYGRFGFLHSRAGLTHIGAVNFLEKRAKFLSQAKLENGSAEDVLKIGEGVSCFYKVISCDSFFQFLQFFLKEIDAQAATVSVGNLRRIQYGKVESTVEFGYVFEGAGASHIGSLVRWYFGGKVRFYAYNYGAAT